MQLIPDVAQAFIEERITASHANLLARLPQEHQATAYENCWRKDWQDKEPHLLPAKHLSAWIQANLYLNLAEAPLTVKTPASTPLPELALLARAAAESIPACLRTCTATSVSYVELGQPQVFPAGSSPPRSLRERVAP